MGKTCFMTFRTKEEASEFAASVIYDIFGAMPSRENMILGTATGNSPALTYEELERLTQKSDWYFESRKHMRFRQLDNYVSPGSSKDNLPEYSYERELGNGIWKIPNGGVFIPREYVANPEDEAKRYAEIVRETSEDANYVLQLLGIGDKDGHIAFNMPGDSFDSTVHVVKLNEETIRSNADKFFGGDTSKVPKEAITMGIGDILKSDGIILEAFGKKKANILWKSFFTKPTTKIPATALQTFEGAMLVLLDEEAASTIAEKQGEGAFIAPRRRQEEKERFIYSFLSANN